MYSLLHYGFSYSALVSDQGQDKLLHGITTAAMRNPLRHIFTNLAY